MKAGVQVRLGVVLLCHDDLGLAARLARVWADGGARVAIHVDAKVPARKDASLRRALADCDGVIFTRRHRCSWGRFSLVRATQDAAEDLLDRFSDTTHVYLASGACLPLRPVAELTAYLAADPDRDHIESVSSHDVGWTVGGLNEERFTLFFPLTGSAAAGCSTASSIGSAAAGSAAGCRQGCRRIWDRSGGA
ncbi:beta-1,6-N-acetylglucosaminyltransferase [Paracoccus aerius]